MMTQTTKTLILSVDKGDWDVVKTLINNGADVRANDDYAIGHATSNGNLDMVRYLTKYYNINNASDARVLDDILTLAVEYEQFNIVQYYVGELNLDVSGDLLSSAVYPGYWEIAHYLAEHLHDDDKDELNSYLFQAVGNEEYVEDDVKLLSFALKYGADINERNEYGQSVLDIAFEDPDRSIKSIEIIEKYLKDDYVEYATKTATKTATELLKKIKEARLIASS